MVTATLFIPCQVEVMEDAEYNESSFDLQFDDQIVLRETCRPGPAYRLNPDSSSWRRIGGQAPSSIAPDNRQ